MSTLAAQQQALVEALFAWPAEDAMKKVAARAIDTGARGQKAYQSNGHQLAGRALQGAYPLLAQLLGDDSFGDLARALWHAQPPQCGDLAQWGDALPDFVQASGQLADEPYLADVARVEWALHVAATASDQTPDLSTLALLTSEDPATLQLTLAPGCRVLRSPWPVASIVGAHLEHSPSLAEAGAQIRDRVAQDTVVWRQGLRSCARAALAGEADALAVLLAAGTLGQALDAAPTLDVGAWLPLAVQTGLLLSVVQIPPSSLSLDP
ncbi:putative DNA-binding domain-containing protein [Rhodoferax saidenbachensis]|uniref:Putative DNA-binding domain-containing protein n=1 Tax=Rhodoferax saidenbachensis TaxID=1484693 RepID=A0ABU1ZP95_9BURK|nr:putative DNA-binding domain-containing protein [Rhodoferax saidenbachensis]MDR7307364.1 hypothetical protein [Rhodoferax saidenbachensis]